MTNKTNTLAEDVSAFLDNNTESYVADVLIRQLLEVIAEKDEVIKDAVFWIDACDVSESLVTPMRQSLASTKELTELVRCNESS